MAVSSSLWFTRSVLVAKRGSAARSACLRTSRQKMIHSRSFWIPKKTEPSLALNGPYGEIDGCLAPVLVGGSSP